MATVQPTINRTHPFTGDIVLAKWVLTGSDDGAAIDVPRRQDVTFKVDGTFGGGSVSVQGVLDPDDSTFVGLNDPQGTAISFTANAAETVLENVYSIRPLAASVTSVNVYMLAR